MLLKLSNLATHVTDHLLIGALNSVELSNDVRDLRSHRGSTVLDVLEALDYFSVLMAYLAHFGGKQVLATVVGLSRI